MQVGILSLQGAIEPHKAKLLELGVSPIEVRDPASLRDISGIILPGGESTTMLHLLKLTGLWGPLREFAQRLPTWGICAGAILLAKKVCSPSQESLSLMNIQVERNGYGRQVESFIAPIESTECWPREYEKESQSLEGVFIRAPRIQEISSEVRPLFQYRDEYIMVEEGDLLVSTFHPELTRSTLLHRYFLEKCRPT